jgi:hypothetical protein
MLLEYLQWSNVNLHRLSIFVRMDMRTHKNPIPVARLKHNELSMVTHSKTKFVLEIH